MADDTNGGAAAPLAGFRRWATFRDAKQDYLVPATTDYTLTFNDDGTVAVVADCNTGQGTYTVNSDGTLTIAVQLLTRANSGDTSVVKARFSSCAARNASFASCASCNSLRGTSKACA